MAKSTENESKTVWTFNWWVTKLVSALALFYLIVSLGSSLNSNNDKANSLKTEHIILFGIILLFNSDLIEKIETFSLGNLSAKFASKEQVDKLGNQVDTLLLGIILDNYEYITLQAIDGKLLDDWYDINPKGESQLERLINRELIGVKGDDSFLKKHNTRIHLREHFVIKEKGRKYLDLVGDKT